MKIKFNIYNNWKDLKYKLFFFYLFGVYFGRYLDYYRLGFSVFGFEFMIEIFMDWGDKNGKM